MGWARILNRACSCDLAIGLVGRIRQAIFRDGRFIVIAAMPKAGSTFLTHVLAEVAGYQRCYFGFAYSNIEQEIYLPKMIDAYGRGSVVHQHFRANASNLDILDRFSSRPVVLTRNVFDAAVSIRDHLITESSENLPAVYPPAGFASWSEGLQFDYIVDFVLPWYLSFFASWVYAERRRKIEMLWVTYEKMIQDWADSILEILRFNGIEVSRDSVESKMSLVKGRPRERIRLNKGVAGRGLSALTDAQRKRLMDQASLYPDVDFGPILSSSKSGLRD